MNLSILCSDECRRRTLRWKYNLRANISGQGSGIVFLAPMWSEVLEADTCSPRCGTPVRATIKACSRRFERGQRPELDRQPFRSGELVCFWTPCLESRGDPVDRIADEWTRMTWGNDPRLVRPIVAMMLSSREAVVDTMTPLGLAHQMATDHHYGPGPWCAISRSRAGTPAITTAADCHGIGFDRTASGSDALAQYAPKVGAASADLKCVSGHNISCGSITCPGPIGCAPAEASGTSSSRTTTEGDRKPSKRTRAEWDRLRPFVDEDAPRRGRRDARPPALESEMVA